MEFITKNKKLFKSRILTPRDQKTDSLANLGSQWIWVKFNWNWNCNGFQLNSVGFTVGFISMKFNWIPMNFTATHWNSNEFHGISLKSNGISLNLMKSKSKSKFKFNWPLHLSHCVCQAPCRPGRWCDSVRIFLVAIFFMAETKNTTFQWIFFAQKNL